MASLGLPNSLVLPRPPQMRITIRFVSLSEPLAAARMQIWTALGPKACRDDVSHGGELPHSDQRHRRSVRNNKVQNNMCCLSLRITPIGYRLRPGCLATFASTDSSYLALPIMLGSHFQQPELGRLVLQVLSSRNSNKLIASSEPNM